MMVADRLRVLLTASLLAAASCGSDPAPPPPTTPPAEPPPVVPEPRELDLPDDPEAIFLEIWDGAGFVPLEYSLGRPPRYAVSVGGDLYYEGPILEIFPGPLLPNLLAARISAAALDSVIAAVRATALPETDDLRIPQPSGGPQIADAPSLETILRERGGSHRIVIEAFGAATPADPRVPPIVELATLLDRLAAETPAEEYASDRLQVYTVPEAATLDPEVRDERPWPLPEPPPADPGVSCRIHEGPIAAALLEVFAAATHASRWDFEGTLYQLLARPLLPGEEACLR